MRRLFVILTLCTCVFLSLSADDAAAINLQHQGHDGHFNFPVPADQPAVYYNNYTRTIIIEGGGEVNYYYVEIESQTTYDYVISTQVDGYYDTIDVSSVTEDQYRIIIYSPTGHIFEGYFTVY